MENFNFYNPTKIAFGKDSLSKLSELIPENATVLITYGGQSAEKFGTLDRVKKILNNHKVYTFGGIEPNPKFEMLMEALPIIEKNNIDFLLAVGGGSVIDGTKFIAAAARLENSNAKNIFAGKVTIEKVLPVGTVLTLPGTGSEMNCNGVISCGDYKKFFTSPLLYPVFSILDPTLTYTLPKKQIANGLVDTFSHVTEQYITYPVDGYIQDGFSESILKTLLKIGEKTLHEPENYEARSNFMWSATSALNDLIGLGVPQDWTAHTIGHQLTATFGLDHGQTLAVVLPAVWIVRKKEKKEKLLQYAYNVWHITHGTPDEIIHEAIEKTRQFFIALGMKVHLSDYGITAKDLEKVLALIEADHLHLLSERGDIDLPVIREILFESL